MDETVNTDVLVIYFSSVQSLTDMIQNYSCHLDCFAEDSDTRLILPTRKNRINWKFQ
uniref:Uncharacterized protein n=1 Tax=Oryza brachyantha TaxID=4533 RepID=J3M5E3_ORYBR